MALITVPGIKSLCTFDDDNWGEKWSFTKKSLKQIFEPVFGMENVQVNSYGNVKISTAYLYGVCAEDLNEKDFDYNDEMYPFILTMKLRKL